jgi:hypothetical protein
LKIHQVEDSMSVNERLHVPSPPIEEGKHSRFRIVTGDVNTDTVQDQPRKEHALVVIGKRSVGFSKELWNLGRGLFKLAGPMRRHLYVLLAYNVSIATFVVLEARMIEWMLRAFGWHLLPPMILLWCLSLAALIKGSPRVFEFFRARYVVSYLEPQFMERVSLLCIDGSHPNGTAPLETKNNGATISQNARQVAFGLLQMYLREPINIIVVCGGCLANIIPRSLALSGLVLIGMIVVFCIVMLTDARLYKLRADVRNREFSVNSKENKHHNDTHHSAREITLTKRIMKMHWNLWSSVYVPTGMQKSRYDIARDFAVVVTEAVGFAFVAWWIIGGYISVGEFVSFTSLVVSGMITFSTALVNIQQPLADNRETIRLLGQLTNIGFGIEHPRNIVA